jgi:flavin-dependent dehydrogenase
MKKFPEQLDVCVIGAGPAGLCAALRLLEMKHTVGMIESEIFPRQQIGESLSPGIRGIFAYLHAEHLLDHESFIHHLPSNIIWESKESKANHTTGNTLVDRSILDQGLLQLAVNRGLHLLQPAKLVDFHRTNEGWELQILSEEVMIKTHATIVLDARGRKGSLAQDRFSISPSLVAIWAHIRADLMPEETFVEAMHEGWFWGTKVSGNRYRVMAFTDGKTIQQQHIKHIHDLAQKTTFFSGIADELKSAPIETCSVTAFVNQNPWNDQFIKLGEAAFTLDPLSSSGVEKAMRFSLQVAIAINTYLKNPNSPYPKDYYEEKLIESVSSHAHWTASFYREAWPNQEDSPFWMNKSQVEFEVPGNASIFMQRFQNQFMTSPEKNTHQPPVSIPIDLVLNQIRWNRISTSPLVTYAKMYAIKEDTIELMLAVDHPLLERPVGYLEQLDLRLLLQEIEGITVETALDLIGRTISFERAKKVMIHLWQYQLILLH